MKQETKQRIVGAIVLLCLALIFLPILFDGEGSYQVPVTSRIPDPPVVPAMPEPVPTRPVIVNEPPAQAQEPEPIATQESDAEPAVADTVSTETVSAEPDSDEPAADAAEPEVAVVESQPAFSREAPALNEDGLPEGWSVRLGAFSDAANASNLLQRLQDSGYKAYSQTSSNAQGELTVVYVGPWLERGLAEDYLQELQQQFQLAGMVVRYELQRL